MSTGFTIIIYILTYIIVSRYLGVFVIEFVGIPGARIAFQSKRKSELRYITGVVIAALCQIYVYNSYMLLVIKWTELRLLNIEMVKFLVWFFCAVASIGPIQYIYLKASKTYKENPNDFLKAQKQSFLITEVVCFVSFFGFVFFSNLIEGLWKWVPQIIFFTD